MRVMCALGVRIIILMVFLFSQDVQGTIIAKSDITICENTVADPMNMVDNKKCVKKMVVIAQVISGQGETQALVATVKKVYDRVEKEDARLYNPFSVKLSMTKISLVYPIYYHATVNNKPNEMVFHSCYTLKGCPPIKGLNGKKILDSEGFCCMCRKGGMFGDMVQGYNSFTDHKRQYQRSGLDCRKLKKASHCMRMDELWYDMHDIGTFTFDFTIYVKAYDQVEHRQGNHTKIEWIEGGEVTLSPFKTAGVGKYGRIVAKYIGKMSSGVGYPRLEDHYFMIPNPASMKRAGQSHPQLLHKHKDYMIFPMHYVELNNVKRCDVIGVTYSAFARQSTHYGFSSFGCHQKIGACLRNQIKDFFDEDTKRRENGQKTKYFPETYGIIGGVKKRPGSTDRVVEFKSTETSSVQVYLEISADDLILLYNRATGIIVRAFATEFEARASSGLATVIVQNTGLVTADFYVTLERCSEGIRAGNEQHASINPQVNFQFNFKLEAYDAVGGSFSCAAHLYDARRYLSDSSVISVNTTSTCICIQQCGCSCEDQDFKCITESNVTFDQEKPRVISDAMDNFLPKLGGFFGTVASVAESAFGVAKGVVVGTSDLVPYLNHVGTILTIVGIIIALIIARMLWQFVPSGVVWSVLKRANKATKSSDTSQAAPPATVVVIHKDSDSDSGTSAKDSVETSPKKKATAAPSAGQVTTIHEFLFEFFFFFILPFLLLYKLLKWIGRPLAKPLWAWLREKLPTVFTKNASQNASEYGSSTSVIYENVYELYKKSGFDVIAGRADNEYENIDSVCVTYADKDCWNYDEVSKSGAESSKSESEFENEYEYEYEYEYESDSEFYVEEGRYEIVD